MIAVAFIFIVTTVYAIFCILPRTRALFFLRLNLLWCCLQAPVATIFLCSNSCSVYGLYTLFKDKDQKLMIFATGHIYRETGTSSMHVKTDDFQDDGKGRIANTAL